MYWQDYIWFMVAILGCMIFSGIASGKVKSVFSKHDKTRCRSGMTGYDTAARLMRANGVTDISVNVGSNVLRNSFDKNDPRGFYQATLSLTESEI